MSDGHNPSVILRSDDDQTAIAKFFDEMNIRIAGGRGTDELARRRLKELRPSLELFAATEPHAFVEAVWQVGQKYMDMEEPSDG